MFTSQTITNASPGMQRNTSRTSYCLAVP